MWIAIGLALVIAVLFGAAQIARQIDAAPGKKSGVVWVAFFGLLVLALAAVAFLTGL